MHFGSHNFYFLVMNQLFINLRENISRNEKRLPKIFLTYYNQSYRRLKLGRERQKSENTIPFKESN